MLVMKLLSPRYVAWITWLPTASADVLRVALPPLSDIAPRSVLVVVSKKSTLPPGVPVPDVFELTVAVNVTGCPLTDGFAELVSNVVVAAAAA